MSATKGTPNPVALGLLRMTLDRDAEIDRLTAALDAAQRETASHRHAALFAAGIHGGPGAWRWASDPTGTILDDAAAWERLLGEMRKRAGRRAPVQGEHNKRDRGPGTIAWDEHVLAWSAYAVRYGRDQSAERIAERGGFGYAELTSLLGHEPKTWAPASE